MTDHIEGVRNHPIERARHRGRGLTAACWGLLLGGLALLVSAELLINVSQWYGWNLSRFDFLHRWGCQVSPATCNSLRVPRFFVPALIATLLGTGLVLLARRLTGYSALLRDIPQGESNKGFSQSRGSQRFGLALAGVGLFMELIGFRVAVTGRPVSPWLWAGGLMVMVAGLAFKERRAGGPPLLHRENLIYLAGIVALLVAAVAVGGGRWPLALLAGVLAMGMLGWFAQQSWYNLDRNGRIERVLLPLIALVAFALAAYGLMSWRWSLVGDEYNFFNLARDILDGRSPLHVLSGAGVDRRHPLLSSYWQALSMQLFGVNSYGWRVASPLLVGLSVLPLYYFVRESSSRAIAFIAVAAFAGSHYLMTHAKIGYNSVQAVFPLCLSLGLFALARRRGSIVGFFLLGVAVGAGFYTYAISRLAMFPVAVLFLLYYPPHRKRSWYLYAVTLLGFLLLIYPVALDRQAWEGQASKSILQSEVADTISGRMVQARNNVLYGFISFMTNTHNSHFTFGAHLDPISGILFILGLGVVLQHLLTSRIHLAWFLSYAALLITITGLQPYAYPSNTWLWLNVPIYTLFIGVGCYALAQVVAGLAGRPGATHMVSFALVALILPLNLWLSVELCQNKTGKQSLAFVLESAQITAGKDGRGPDLHVIAQRDFHWPLMSYMFTAYEIPWNRFILHNQPADVEETVEQLCNAADSPVILLVAQTYPGRDIIQRRMEACWPEAREQTLVDGVGTRHFLRFITPSALSWARGEALALFPDATPEPTSIVTSPLELMGTATPLPGVTPESTPVVIAGEAIEAQPWEIYQPRDVAVAADGRVAAIEGTKARIVLFDPEGEAIFALDAGFKDPSAIAFDPEGLLIVLDSGEGDALVYISLAGRVQRRVGSAVGFYSPRGLDVTSDGRLYVADTGGQRVVALAPDGQVLAQFRGGGILLQPTDVAVLPGDRLLVTDPGTPALYMLNAKYQILWELPLASSDTTVAAKVAVSAKDWLVVSDPGRGRVLRVSLAGHVLEEWTGLAGPTGLTVGEDGTIYVAETSGNRISRLQPTR